MTTYLDVSGSSAVPGPALVHQGSIMYDTAGENIGEVVTLD